MTVDALKALVPQEAPLRSGFFTVEPARTMRARGFEWDHELRVALPASYGSGNSSYPVLWIMDNQLEESLALLQSRELILVSVGSPRVPTQDNAVRRTYDFTPGPDQFFDGPLGDSLRRHLEALWPETATPEATGGAQEFLDFLVDDARQVLAADYRMDPEDHGIVGFSQGGTFVGFSLFARPGAFKRYILGSGALYTGNGAIFDLEATYAAEHDDLPAHVFLAAGDGEITEPVLSSFGLVSATARLAETLTSRGYPSLRLTMKVFPGETHQTMFPLLLSWGVRTVWGDNASPFTTRGEE
jgi:predicted alpha/beta superfamily hydrolase